MDKIQKKGEKGGRRGGEGILSGTATGAAGKEGGIQKGTCWKGRTRKVGSSGGGRPNSSKERSTQKGGVLGRSEGGNKYKRTSL